MRERLLGTAIVLVLLGGVAGAVTAGGDSEETAARVTLAAGPVAERIEFILAWLNDGTGTDQLGEVFAPSFLASVSAAQVEELAARSMRPAGPFTIAEVEQSSPQMAVLLLRGPTGVSLRMSIAVAETAPHKIEGLLFREAAPDTPKPESWEELDDRMRDAAPDVAFLAATIEDGECRPVHAVDEKRVLPLGSAFKLYVLGAAADAVAAGSASWDDVLMITDERRVHSSMTYGSAPAGTKVSLRDAATAMISVSDNTATDLVMDHIGRAAVEAQLPLMGMADPARNLPFLTTRELTFVKWVLSEEERADYVAADTDRRRALLDALPNRGATLEDLSDLAAGPVAVSDLEWFASPLDLCRAHVALQTKGEEARRILSVNAGTGLEFDRDALPYIGFKGGSEPGVLAGSWYAETTDGRQRFVAGLFKNDEAEVATSILRDVAAAFELFD